MRRYPTSLSTVGTLIAVLMSGPAMAEERAIVVRGAADLGAGAEADIRDARVRAIDTALAAAVGRALADLLDDKTRKRNRQLLNAELVKRARRYVAGFKVLAEEADGDRYRVRIRARLDLDTVRARLLELGIERDSSAEPSSEPRPKVTVLTHATLGERVEVSFGSQGRARGASFQTVITHLDEQGFTTVAAVGTEAPAARELPPGVPLSDEAAAEVARAVGAGGAFVVGVKAWREGPIRATSLIGALATATIRVVDVPGGSDGGSNGASTGRANLLAQAEVRAAGYGPTEDQALADASARAAERAMRAVIKAVIDYWPPQVASAEDALLIEVRGYRTWRDVRALHKQLADTQGITRTWPRQLGRSGVVLAAETKLSRRRVAAALRRTALSDARVSTRRQGEGRLLVTITGSAADGSAEGSP